MWLDGVTRRFGDTVAVHPLDFTVNGGEMMALLGPYGGSLSLATARARPVETLLSGPASGVMAATRLAGQAGVPRVITPSSLRAVVGLSWLAGSV